MAEREIYNEQTGQWELINSHGGYLENPYYEEPAAPPSQDPDNPPWDGQSGWLFNGNQQPTQDPGAGNYWSWDGRQWNPRPVPHAPTPPPTTPAPPGNPPPPGEPFGPAPPPRLPLSNLNQTYPEFNAPQFQAPKPFEFDPFAYEDFKAPSLQQAQAEPGFEYALQQGIKAFENSKAYLGTYRSGGTIKGLNDYARNMANQNYGQVYARTADTYDRNRGNAFGQWNANRNNAADTYATNYGVSRDVFDRNYQGAKDEYAPKARSAELQFGREWDQFAYEGDDAYRRWKALVDANAV